MCPVNSGIDQLEGMRERRTRQAPEPRHTKLEMEPSATDAVPMPQFEAPAPEPVTPSIAKTVVPKPQKTPPTPSVADTSTTVNIASYITAEALAAVRRMRGRDSPGGVIALQAISAMRTQLPDLIAERHVGSVRRSVDDSLFPHRSGNAAGKGVSRRMWVIRLTPGELEAVDGLMEKFGASSRSELISVAVEAYVADR